VDAVGFREPEGRRTGLLYRESKASVSGLDPDGVHAGLGVCWFALFLFNVLASGDTFAMQVLVGTAFVLRGLAGMTPSERARLAGGLRAATALLGGLVLGFVSVNVAGRLL
jgi:hypothetical protein